MYRLCVISASLLLLFIVHGCEGVKPNIVFILADDYGFNDIGYHGSEIKVGHMFCNIFLIVDIRFNLNRGWDTQSPMPIGKLVLFYKAIGICLIFVNIEVQSKLFNQTCFTKYQADSHCLVK